MGKLDSMMQGRNEGLVMALDIVKKGGIEALEEEIKYRRLTGLSPKITKKELEAIRKELTNQISLVYVPLSVFTLHDQFGFGKKRCLDFANRFLGKVAALNDRGAGVTWKDYVQAVKDEIGLDLYIDG